MSSAMEALAINYLNHGVLTAVNNVWTWIAFLTAAISFWKIKSSTTDRTTVNNGVLLVPSPPSPDASTVADQPPTTNSTTAQSFPSSITYAALCTSENRRSGKFSVYYPQDDDGDKQGVGYGSGRRMDHQEDDRRTMGCSVRRRRNHDEQAVGWEAVLEMKTSEMEWYRYQDLTALNGNVVRLWNEINVY